MKLIITTIFGLESVVKDELAALGYEPRQITVDNGKIILDPEDEQVARSLARLNINLRCAERVLLQLPVTGKVKSFDELFDLAAKIAWEDHIPKDWAFYVNGHSLKSELFGIRACQSIIKKSIVKRLAVKRGLKPGSQIKEDKNKGIMRIVFSIVKDRASFMLDSTGDGLHKRGYRPLNHFAPLKETLAAGLVMLSMWRHKEGEVLLDPLCGSGTIPIEAALIARNIAPGLKRSFSAEAWGQAYKQAFKEEKLLAAAAVLPAVEGEGIQVFGSDIEAESIRIARENSESAGVSDFIDFIQRDALEYKDDFFDQAFDGRRVLIVTNPPYGERMMEYKEAADLFSGLGQNWLDADRVKRGLRLSIMAPKDTFEEDFGLIADRRRKLYNGKIQCNMYHYFKQGRKED